MLIAQNKSSRMTQFDANTAVSINVVGLRRTQQDRKAVWVFLSSRLSGA